MRPAIAPTTDLSACLSLRKKVFVEEQGVPIELEQDALDAEALHFLALVDTGPVGTARVLVNGATAKIGRVCVLPDARRRGIGAALIEAALDEIRRQPGVDRAALGAQLSAISFYERLEFVAYGDVFDDAGIAHQMMERIL